jgi:cytochrome c5
MDSQKTGKFFVGSIVTFLIIFGLVKIILSTMLDIEKQSIKPESMAAVDIVERIKPLAQAYIGEAPVMVVAAVVESVGGGKQIVTQVCALCHSSGMMSSPRLGNKKDWAPRIEKGVETLYSNAINGLNMMPARGGRPDLSDDDVKSAVDYMISLTQ